MPSSSPARAHPSTDRLGVAGAAQDPGRGVLSPGDQVAGFLLEVTRPGVVVQSDDPEGRQPVQHPDGQRGEAVCMQIEVSQSVESVQRARQHLDQQVVGQVDDFQVCGQVGGQRPEVVAAQVERAQVDQGVVDEDGALQLVAGQVQSAQVPLVHRVVLVQQLEAVEGGVEVPERAGQTNREVAQPVVGQIEEAEVGVGGELAVQVVEAVVGHVEGEYVVLQAVGQLSETPPGAVHLPVAAAARADGGAHGGDVQPRQQRQQEEQQGPGRGELRQHTPARRKTGRRGMLAFVARSILLCSARLATDACSVP